MNWSLLCASLALYLMCGFVIAEASTRHAAQEYRGKLREDALSGRVFLNICFLWALYSGITIYRQVKKGMRHGKS